ncbi:MAG: hypothetical protein E5299_01060 [Burkholderia gladioli]|nr:MAG: hypothetical protein E5299_01060 [Burkholderia gladioli]
MQQRLTVSHILMRHQRGNTLDPSIRVERKMKFMPRAPLRVAVVAHLLLFSFAIDLQTGAVDQ